MGNPFPQPCTGRERPQTWALRELPTPPTAAGGGSGWDSGIAGPGPSEDSLGVSVWMEGALPACPRPRCSLWSPPRHARPRSAPPRTFGISVGLTVAERLWGPEAGGIRMK